MLSRKLVALLGALQIASLLLTVFLVFLLVRLVLVFPWRAEDLVHEEEPKQADVIVILSGEVPVRLEYGFDLVEKGFAQNVFTPDVKHRADARTIERRRKSLPGSVRYFRDYGTESTYDEALATRRFLVDRDFKAILLVTSPFHSYRAWWLFKKMLPDHEVISTPVPLADSRFSLENAGPGGDDYNTAMRERGKFLYYYFMSSIGIFR